MANYYFAMDRSNNSPKAKKEVEMTDENRHHYNGKEFSVIASQGSQENETRFFYRVDIYENVRCVYSRVKQKAPEAKNLQDAQITGELFARGWIDSRVT